MTTHEMFSQEISKIVDKYFTDVALNVGESALGLSTMVSLTLGSGKNEYPHGISQNDPLRVNMMITNEDNFEIEYYHSYVGRLKPKHAYYAQSSLKIPSRKARGDINKILKSVDKYLKRVADTVKELAQQDEFLPLPYNPVDKVK